MKEVRFKLTDEEFDKAKLSANALSLKTVSQYSKYLVCLTSYENRDKLPLQFEDKGNLVRKQINIHLEPVQIELLENNANLHGWSRSKEAAFRIRSTLSNEPNLYIDEVKSLDLARTAVNKIGRNINFILKNNQSIVNDSNFYTDITELLSEINNINKLVLGIVQQSKNRFLK